MVELQFYTGIVGFGNGIFPGNAFRHMKISVGGESGFFDKYVKTTERPEDSIHAVTALATQQFARS